jgi:hypothetical protein
MSNALTLSTRLNTAVGSHCGMRTEYPHQPVPDRPPDRATDRVQQELAAWATHTNDQQRAVDWQFKVRRRPRET